MYCYTELFVRLACIRHAANVHPEPGSNSPQKILTPIKVYVSLLAEVLDLIRSTFIDEVCHLPITLQLLRCYLSPRENDFTQLPHDCQGLFCFFRQKRRCYLANTGRLNYPRNFNVLNFMLSLCVFSFEGSAVFQARSRKPLF